MSAFLENSEPTTWCCMKCSYLSLPSRVFSHNLSSSLLCGSYSLLFMSFCVREQLVSWKRVTETDGEANPARKWQFAYGVSCDGFSDSLWREEGPSADADWSGSTNVASRSPHCASMLFMARTRPTCLWIFTYHSPIEASSGTGFLDIYLFFFLPFPFPFPSPSLGW